jgi:hypothetical protein
MKAVHVLTIHDPQRRPASWAEIIQPGQLAAFATPSDGTCVLFDSLAEARAWCEAAVTAAPDARFDVFDAEGRAHPPLLTVVHPSREQALDTHPRALRKRRVIGWALIAAGIPLIVYACWIPTDISVIFPGVIGINLLLAGGRFLWFNLGVRETERAREERLAKVDSRRQGPA